MKHFMLAALFCALLLTGCSDRREVEERPAEDLKIQAPGVDVEIGKQGVDVEAPGTHVDVDQQGVDVNAPGTDVDVEKEGVDVNAPETEVEVK